MKYMKITIETSVAEYMCWCVQLVLCSWLEKGNDDDVQSLGAITTLAQYHVHVLNAEENYQNVAKF